MSNTKDVVITKVYGDEFELQCTPKCTKAMIESDSIFTEEAKQLCWLLKRSDGLCKQISSKLSAKIDIQPLIDHGFIKRVKIKSSPEQSMEHDSSLNSFGASKALFALKTGRSRKKRRFYKPTINSVKPTDHKGKLSKTLSTKLNKVDWQTMKLKFVDT